MPVEKSHSMPVLEKKPALNLFGRRMSNKSRTDLPASPSTSSTSIDTKNEGNPDALEDTSSSRSATSASFVPPSAPVVATDTTHADVFKPSSSPPNESPAAASMANFSANRQSPAIATTPTASPFKPPYITSKSSHSSNSSQEATDSEKDTDQTPQPRRNTASSTGSHDDGSANSSSLSTKGSLKSQTGSIARGLFARRETASTPPTPVSPSLGDAQKRTALAAVTNAAASAKQWGLSALQRHANKGGIMRDSSFADSDSTLDLNQPMGRGRPLPPPGTPLPMPDKKTKTAPIPAPKRKPVAPPPAIPHHESSEDKPERRRPVPPPGDSTEHRRPVPPPPLPKRRQLQSEHSGDGENMLVVAAPADSEPASPSGSNTPSYMPPSVEDAGDGSGEIPQPTDDKKDSKQHAVPGGGGTQPHIRVEDPLEDLILDDDDAYSAWMDNTGLEESEGDEVTESVKI